MPSYPSNKCPEEDKKQEIKLLFGNIPHSFELSDQFLFQCEKPSAHDRGGFLAQHRFRSRLTGYSRQWQQHCVPFWLSGKNRCDILQIHPWPPGTPQKPPAPCILNRSGNARPWIIVEGTAPGETRMSRNSAL